MFKRKKTPEQQVRRELRRSWSRRLVKTDDILVTINQTYFIFHPEELPAWEKYEIACRQAERRYWRIGWLSQSITLLFTLGLVIFQLINHHPWQVILPSTLVGLAGFGWGLYQHYRRRPPAPQVPINSVNGWTLAQFEDCYWSTELKVFSLIATQLRRTHPTLTPLIVLAGSNLYPAMQIDGHLIFLSRIKEKFEMKISENEIIDKLKVSTAYDLK